MKEIIEQIWNMPANELIYQLTIMAACIVIPMGIFILIMERKHK